MIPTARLGTKLSVVIAAWNGLSSLERCLRSLKADGQASDTEVIVVTNFDAAEMLETQFPCVQHVAASSHTTVPVLRAIGIFSVRRRDRGSGRRPLYVRRRLVFGNQKGATSYPIR